MNPQNDEEVLRKDYLLGKLDDRAREQVEERLLDDDEFVEKLADTEDNLIDDYVFGVLSRSERQSFEKNFVINDERRNKLQLAQSFDAYLDKLDHPTQGTSVNAAPWWTAPLQVLRSYKFWIAVPALLILVFFAPAIVRWWQRNDQIALVQTDRARIERRIAEFNRQSTQTLPSQELTLNVASAQRDAGGINRVTLSQDVKSLTLRLAIPSPPQENYRGIVSTLEGTELFTINDFHRETDSGRTVLRVNLPTEVLPTGDYELQLGGIGPDGQLTNPVRYYFGLIKHGRNVASETESVPAP